MFVCLKGCHGVQRVVVLNWRLRRTDVLSGPRTRAKIRVRFSFFFSLCCSPNAVADESSMMHGVLKCCTKLRTLLYRLGRTRTKVTVSLRCSARHSNIRPRLWKWPKSMYVTSRKRIIFPVVAITGVVVVPAWLGEDSDMPKQTY